MIRGVAITNNRRPTLAFRKDWDAAMRAKKALDPTFVPKPLPNIEIVDDRGFPLPPFVHLALPLEPALVRQQLVNGFGQPTDYALKWWDEAT